MNMAGGGTTAKVGAGGAVDGCGVLVRGDPVVVGRAGADPPTGAPGAA